MRIYLAGPITGIPDWNTPAFNEAAAKLRALGHVVFNPAEGNDDKTLSLAEYMAIDLPEVCRAEGMALLPGWIHSVGANIEYEVAKRLRKKILPVELWLEEDPFNNPTIPL